MCHWPHFICADSSARYFGSKSTSTHSSFLNHLVCIPCISLLLSSSSKFRYLCASLTNNYSRFINNKVWWSIQYPTNCVVPWVPWMVPLSVLPLFTCALLPTNLRFVLTAGFFSQGCKATKIFHAYTIPSGNSFSPNHLKGHKSWSRCIQSKITNSAVPNRYPAIYVI